MTIERRTYKFAQREACKIIVIVNSVTVYYLKADAAYARISSDKLRKMEEEVFTVEYKHEFHECLFKSSMKRRILAGKQ